ncbi:MAG TPA: amino acid ABC transporter substrate-binding protein [Gaiellaceae bacterium]|nr:amino acid ABC transporter substrate-binding protein [Gaiellaceae bacterium]
MTQRRFRVGALALATVLALGVWSATSLASTSARSQSTAKPVLVGISLSLSGDFSDEGKAAMRGYKLWQASVNAQGGLLGHKVQLKIVDDTSSPNQAVTNYENLISHDKVDFVLGPFSTLLTAPSATVAHRYGYAFIEPAGGGPAVFQAKLNNVFFAQPAPAVRNADVLAKYILSLPKAQRPKTAAYPALDDPFAAPPIERLQKILEKHGIKTVYSKIYPSETTDYSPIIQAVVNAKPDLIAAGTQNVDGYAMAKGLIQLKYNPKFLYIENGANSPLEFPSKIGGRANTTGIFSSGDWFPQAKFMGNKQFVKAYVKAYGGRKNGQDIDTTTAEAYSAGQILAEAVAKTNSLDNKKIIAALHKGVWHGVNGNFHWTKYGSPTGNSILVQWVGGNLVPVFPKSVALHKPIAKPKWHG